MSGGCVATFELLPAIDLRDGQVVRLRQGDFEHETSYESDSGRGRAAGSSTQGAPGSTSSTSTAPSRASRSS